MAIIFTINYDNFVENFSLSPFYTNTVAIFITTFFFLQSWLVSILFVTECNR